MLLYNILTLIVLFVCSCKHEAGVLPNQNSGTTNGGINVSPAAICSADSVYFTNTILPLITSNCASSGCHDAVTHQKNVYLYNYSGILAVVKPGNASNSKLIKVLTETDATKRMPPPPAASLTSTQIADIQKWINQGANNNSCIGPCNASVITYSGAVANTINVYCKGCHNPQSLSANIDLSTYNGVKVQALNGKLVGAISHNPGFAPMPKLGNKLSSCQITQIQQWINAGSLNN